MGGAAAPGKCSLDHILSTCVPVEIGKFGVRNHLIAQEKDKEKVRMVVMDFN